MIYTDFSYIRWAGNTPNYLPLRELIMGVVTVF